MTQLPPPAPPGPPGPPVPPVSPPPPGPAASPRKRTGLVVTAIVAVLLLIGGGITAAVLLGGDDEKPPSDDTRTSEAPTTTVPDLGGPTIEGRGYQVQLPDGWTDGTTAFQKANPDLTTIDKVFLWGPRADSARGNVIVETEAAYGYTDPNDLKARWKKALTSDDKTARITDGSPTTINGQTALTAEITRTNNDGTKVQQRAHLVISNNRSYSITASLQAGDDDVLSTFARILSTWQWGA